MRLRTQVLLLQVAVLVVSLGVGFGYLTTSADDRVRSEYGERALAIARTVASEETVRVAVADHDSTTLQPLALAAAERNDALFVVIADADGIRLAHPDPAEIGRPLSTDPGRALSGRDDITTEEGTLGESVRAKVPVFAAGSATRVVGLVSVGISTAALGPVLRGDLLRLGLLAAVALAVGVAGSSLLARRWRRLTLGLEPEELTELVREKQAVLHALGEGVLAVDAQGVVRVLNGEAQRLLDLPADAVGRPVTGLGLPDRVVLATQRELTDPIEAIAGERIVLVSSHDVPAEAGRPDLGLVVSVVDRTDVETLTRELDAVRSMTEVLRVQRHEQANRQHLVAGLLRRGDADQALAVLEELMGHGGVYGLDGIENVAEPHLHAFLDVKAAQARERGVRVALGPQTWVEGELADPAIAATVVGNLVDNAVDAVLGGGAAARAVEVELITDGTTLLVSVADSGPGIAAADPADVFAEGVTTKPSSSPGGRGLGLALARRLARRTGGDVVVADPGGSRAGEGNQLGGAVLVATIPQALVAP